VIFKNGDGYLVALALVRAVAESRDYLSEVDGLIGDGDHGVNMNKGFALFAQKLGDAKTDLTGSFQLLGRTLLGDIGGSMGPLYGTFFREMSKVSKGHGEIDAALFADMLDAALNGVKSIGGAKPGDKTLVDCLEPAAAAFRTAAVEGKDLRVALRDMEGAARAGLESTKDMAAKLGRASRLGERSRGVLDAGAASCCVLLCAMADEIIARAE